MENTTPSPAHTPGPWQTDFPGVDNFIREIDKLNTSLRELTVAVLQAEGR